MSESLNSSSNCPKSFGGAHCANAGKAILAKALTKSRKEVSWVLIIMSRSKVRRTS